MDFKYYTIGLLWLLICLTIPVTAQTCSENDEEFFLSFHPHLDAFWLNTDDELKNINFRPEGFLYMMNQRNSKTIFNSMLQALGNNPQRKYFTTEAFFIKDWYDYLPQGNKEKVKEFIKSGQLEITNGGWVQNDQAVCYIDDIIDQYTVGHNFFYSQFGEVVKIAWATDSFGHSHSQAAIEHLLGFQIQGIERIDDRYIFQRKNGSLLQFYWSAVSDSNNIKYGGVYTHIRHFLHQFVNYRPMQPNMIANDHGRMKDVIKRLYRRKKMFRFVGNDFQEFIDEEFQKLEKAMKDLNSNGNSQCSTFKWGNPSEYFKWVKKDAQVSVRESDFLPNFDQDHYWTGYYTTNPELKIVCKDFSRMVNFFRKVYLKHQLLKGDNSYNYQGLLQHVDQLLAIMQHHDGIAATSKYHIQAMFVRRMREAMQSLVQAIQRFGQNRNILCELFNNGNRCSLPGDQGDHMFVTVLHEGAPKVERVEFKLAQGTFYQVEEDKNDNVFCTPQGDCVLIFQAALKAGQNLFNLNSVPSSSPLVVNWTQAGSLNVNSQKFSIQIDSRNNVKYSLSNGQFITLSLVRSRNQQSSTNTRTWNKFGDPINKNERRVPGIYIMSNTGSIQSIPEVKLTVLNVIYGKRYNKVKISGQVGNFQITINNNQPKILEVETIFRAPSTQTWDYFLKVDSDIKSDGQFYHDVNGFLVSKRKVGVRYDYQWNYKKQDKINANNYPMCSFAYVVEGNKKFVVFTDRAQGMTNFDDSILVNIDRLTYDDWKGAGQGYMHMVQNTFRFKIGLVEKSNHVQRSWQRMYDQALLAFVGKGKDATPAGKMIDRSRDLLKYTIFLLNKDQFVVRLFNLGETQSISVPKFNNNQWKVDSIGINFKYTDVRQAFANGIPLGERKVWKKVPGQINVFNAGSKDTHSELYLEPLQVRSFRVNKNSMIKAPVFKNPGEELADITITEAKPLGTFLKRCF